MIRLAMPLLLLATPALADLAPLRQDVKTCRPRHWEGTDCLKARARVDRFVQSCADFGWRGKECRLFRQEGLDQR